MSLDFQNWISVLQRRAQLLHQQIAAMQALVRDSGGTNEDVERACTGLYRLLDQLYEHDMPIARGLDNSDLLLHLEGEGLDRKNPSLSLVNGIMGDVRKQVGTMIKTLVSSLDETLELPREFELGLSSFARGSLYLGFTVPEPDERFATLSHDPLVSASHAALGTLGAVSALCEEPDGYDLIRRDFADPKLRDAALSALGQLAPSGRRGVTSIGLGGRDLGTRSWPTLTPQTRRQVRSWLDRPVLSDEAVTLAGRVRAIDLDLRRFDLRRIDGGNLPDLRCIYPAAFDPPARGWLDQVVRVTGRVETFQGVARLLQVTDVSDVSVTAI
jgi:hypothetical protein